MFCVLRTDPLRTACGLKTLNTAYQRGGGAKVTLMYDLERYDKPIQL